MRKCILVVGLLIVTGCASQVARWENVGTLVSVGPAETSSRSAGRMGTALGENEWGLTRVETTEGTFIISEKMSVAQTGDPVKVGYDKNDSQGKPSYLSVGGRQYKIAR